MCACQPMPKRTRRRAGLVSRVMSINRAADQRLTPWVRSCRLGGYIAVAAAAGEIPDGGGDNDHQQDEPPVIRDPSARGWRGERRGAGVGAGVCAQADETARKIKPISAVSLLMRCLRVRRPSTSTPPNCQAGPVGQRPWDRMFLCKPIRGA